ncbi:MAG TPA: flagellar biosynthetic protein FliR [Acidobacteriaceae bacterium]|jgi:flagellar biosynthetic protein FliR|nr:flagellar biosynthetic protein FliR [Acidobacteriaceae bacterium]
MQDWSRFLTASVLVLIRISALMVFAPIFSSGSIPKQVKIAFAIALTVLLVPVAATQGSQPVALGLAPVAGELGVGFIFGFSLSLLNEMITFAGEILGLQFSFSLVNVLDPNSPVETPVLGQLLSLIGLLVLFAAGLDRTILAALMRSFVIVPVGQAFVAGRTGIVLITMTGGVFLAAVQLAAPVLAATLMVELTVALIGRLSPQLPVLFVGIPVKTLVGYAVLIGSLGVWPRYIEARFTGLLNQAMQLVMAAAPHH